MCIVEKAHLMCLSLCLTVYRYRFYLIYFLIIILSVSHIDSTGKLLIFVSLLFCLARETMVGYKGWRVRSKWCKFNFRFIYIFTTILKKFEILKL